MPSRRARGNGLRTKHACSIPGRTTSSTKVPWPVSSRARPPRGAPGCPRTDRRPPASTRPFPAPSSRGPLRSAELSSQFRENLLLTASRCRSRPCHHARVTATDEGPCVEGLHAEYRGGPVLGIGAPSPRLSWTTSDRRIPGWAQAAYEVEVAGTACGRVDGPDSVFVPWPTTPLRSREARPVRVRVWGTDGSAIGVERRRSWSKPGSSHPTTGPPDGSPPARRSRSAAAAAPAGVRPRRAGRAGKAVRDVGRDPPAASQRRAGGRPRAGPGLVGLRQAPALRHPRRHRPPGRRRQRPRRRRGRRLVARAPRVGDEAQRLRRSPRAPRAARGHLRRRHDRTGHDRRPLADRAGALGRRRPLQRRDLRRPPRPSTAGRPRASTTPGGPRRSASGRPSASSWPRPRRPCAASRSWPSSR